MPPRPPGVLRRWAADAREIVAPSSLPDPLPAAAGGQPARPRRRSLADRWRLVVAGTRDYLDSWRAAEEPAAEAEAEAGAGAGVAGNAPADDRAATPAASPSSAAEAAARAAVRGAEALRPGVQHLFRSRAAAYREAVFSFAEGFREGVEGGGQGGGGGGEGGGGGAEASDARRRRPPPPPPPPPPHASSLPASPAPDQGA
jgi:hypothetical protein